MQVSDEAIRFSLPNVAAPFTTIQRVSSAEGHVDRNRPHYHPDTIEICAVVRGQLDWFVAEEAYAVKPGEVLVVPAEVVHGAVDSNLQPCELVTVHLAPEQLLPNLAEAARALTARRVRHAGISALVQRIFQAHRDAGGFLPEVVAALGTLLVASIVELEEGDDERKKGRLIRQAQRAMMGGNASRPTVDEVAERLGVSSVWLHKLFVRETGASPGDWARAKRLSDAKRMLEEGRLSTVAIAMSLGYASGQSFATAFRRESGMTPSDYRALHTDPEARSRTVYRVDMRETWVDGVRVYPPLEGVRVSEV